MSNTDNRAKQVKTRVHGVLAEFSSVDAVMAAAVRMRDAGYTKWDVHSPFPIHGMDQAMGMRPTRLPWLIFVMGITGTFCALLLQWWTNAHDYVYLISGKPDWSVPANVPVAFELTVLFSALTAVFASLGLNRLPELYHPLFSVARFKKVTDDKFFVVVESGDPIFDEGKTTALLKSAQADAVELVTTSVADVHFKLPLALTGAAGVLVILTLIPLGLAARARLLPSEKPRIHVIPDDMDAQYKLKAQGRSAVFEQLFGDPRGMRKAPTGTVARGDFTLDDTFTTGANDGVFAADFPKEVQQSPEFVARGQERYGIYCAPCHGLAGEGDGLVSQRVEALGEGTWVAPTSLHAAHVRTQPLGQLFNTITNGIRNMPPYGAQIPVHDRWAIVGYIKALQLSQNAPADAAPAGSLPTR